ncbi:Predicted membrane protein [Psychrobacillus sp. OK028]|uniref:DUF2207 domain-containing protein n=1 Tax=Psychrobacillus sp. OK028 TaxID=1884359 RepID=UPI00088DC664|nr:DUF2207 domain-containing protein [Psychrobacillus sp. OK028]SDM75905.1 Predicted membrane protein [Psychrobacillus sp. OK028]
MKKFLLYFLLIFLSFSFGIVAEAKSYSIDKVHIKSWIQPNGDLLVNEVFTYNFEGSFSNLRRSFPTEHGENVEEFYAYELNQLDLEPGFIDQTMMTPLEVQRKNNTFYSNIGIHSQQVSFLYVYRLKKSITAYDNYNDLDVVYFEDGDAHDQDFSNLTIDYIFPETVETKMFEGVFYNKTKVQIEKNNIGIRFRSPAAKAYTETKTSLIFPANLISTHEKIKASLTYEEALANEIKKQKEWNKKLSYLDALISFIPKVSFAMLLIILSFLLFLPQRHFWRKGQSDVILSTDVLYLFFVDKCGKPHPKAFLAGLFSLVEKGAVKVKHAKSALRFKHDPKAPEETLDFRLINGGLAVSAFEKHLISWLFTTKSGSRKWAFHLHDAAGAAKDNRDSKFFHTKVKVFKKKQTEWHHLVEKELEEAGAINSKIPLLIISAAILIVSMITMFAYYANAQSYFAIAFIITITISFLVILWIKKRSTLFLSIYLVLLFFSIASIGNEEVVDLIIGLLFLIIVLYLVVPRNILSMNAVRAKDAIRSYRKELKNGMPFTLGNVEQEKWIIRAYLLGRKNIDIPLKELSIPIATVLFASTDPIDYVTKSWSRTKVSTSSSDGGGSYGGDSSGGGGDGGGGAGAD